MTLSHDDIPFGSWSEFHRNVGRRISRIVFRLMENDKLSLVEALDKTMESRFYEELENPASDAVWISDYYAYSFVAKELGFSGDDIKLPVLKNCPLWLETAMVAFEKAKDHLVNGSGTHPEGYSLYLTLKRQGFPESIKEDASRNKDTDTLAKKLATKAQMPSFYYKD